MKLTITTSPSRVFFDLWINLQNSHFSFNCYQNPQNAYQYLSFSSDHPLHLKWHFIINERKWYLIREITTLGFLRMKRLFFSKLVKRGYPPSHIRKNYNNIKFSARSLIYNMKPNFKLAYTRDTPRIGIHGILKDLYGDLLIGPQLSKLAFGTLD